MDDLPETTGGKTTKPGRRRAKADPRVEATNVIWGAAIALFGVSIPLAFVFRSPTITFVVIGAAAAATAALWAFGGNLAPWRTRGSSPDLAAENADLRARLAELEERLANVETISAFEMRLAADERARAESRAAAPRPGEAASPAAQATERATEGGPG